MRFLILAALAAATLAPATALAYEGIPRKAGEVRGRVGGVTDLPGPMVQLRVAHVQPLEGGDAVWRSQLVVLGAGGKPVWEGPKGPAFAPLVYQGGPAGEDELEAAGPVEREGDGQVVLVMGQSDVRIPTHQFLRWTGHGFVEARKAKFVEQPAKSGRFVPTTNAEPRGRWIARFTGVVSPGRCRVSLGVASEDGGGNERVDGFVVRATKDGFQLVR